MAKLKGERLATKSREAVKVAFRLLLQGKSYADISVGEIAAKADVGRSTFYRHFNGKPDVLIALHEDIFERLFLNPDAPMDWMGEHASPALCDLMCRFFAAGGPNVSLGSDIGADADYIMQHVSAMLASYVQESLSRSYPSPKTTVPLSVLSASITGICAMTLMSWKRSFRDIPPEQTAEYIHRLWRAVVDEGFENGARTFTGTGFTGRAS